MHLPQLHEFSQLRVRVTNRLKRKQLLLAFQLLKHLQEPLELVQLVNNKLSFALEVHALLLEGFLVLEEGLHALVLSIEILHHKKLVLG